MRTGRLDLPVLDRVEAEQILGLRPAVRPWGAGYPTDGDLLIARITLAEGDTAEDQFIFGRRVIVLRATGQAIGGIGFSGPPVEGDLVVGYGLAEPFRRRGLVSEALRALLQAVGGRSEVRGVYADTDPDNEESQQVLVACGFTRGPDRDGLRVFRWSPVHDQPQLGADHQR
jgi:RimJ/RimL family protein N-acetyltransferase